MTKRRPPARRRAVWTGIPKPSGHRRAALKLTQWTDETKDECCARIAAHRSTFKILLKTKDDPYFLDTWLTHHARIVGLENLILFDNMSSDLEVLRTLQTHQSKLPIFRFEGNHNVWHDTEKVPELYAALEQSCDFYAFLDTDEFLVLVSGDEYFCDERIVRFIQAGQSDVLPASWLWSIPHSDTRFGVGHDLYDFGRSLSWGKPVIRSSAGIRGYINHNVHLGTTLYSDHVQTNLFALHLMQLFPEQRIEANVSKLVALGFATPDDSIDQILTRDPAFIADPGDREQARVYVEQLTLLHERRRSRKVQEDEVPARCIELTPRGQIRYHSQRERDGLNTFLTNPHALVHAVSVTDLWDVRTLPRHDLIDLWKRLGTTWDYERMQVAVKHWMTECLPDGAGAAIISKGDLALTESDGRPLSHFPQDEGGGYTGVYPANDAEAIGLVDALPRRGIEFLIVPSTAFWWLDYYTGLRKHLDSRGEQLCRTRDCIIYRLSTGQPDRQTSHDR